MARRPASPSPSPHAASPIGSLPPPTRSEWLAAAAIAAVVVLRIALTYVPVDARLWGIDFARYAAGDPIALALVLLPLGAFVPGAGSVFRSGGAGRTLPPLLFWPGVVLLAGAAGWIAFEVHMLFALYGDGSYYQTEIIRLLAAPEAPSSLVKPTGWLAGVLVTTLARTVVPDDARVPYVLAGAVSMVLMVGGSLALVRGMRRREAALLVLPLVGSAGTLVLCGYVELYALPFALAVLHLVASWRAVREGRSLVPALVLLALASAASVTALVLAPAHLAAWLMRGQDAARARARAMGVTMGAVVLVTAAVASLGGNLWNPLVLPLQSADMISAAGVNEGAFAYTMFSAAHLADVVNILLLFGAPALAVLLVSIPWMRRVGVSHPLFLYAWALVTFASAALLVGYAYFGLARDWDAMAIPMLALPFAASAVLVLRVELGARMRGMLMLAYVVASVAGGLVWIRTNTLPAAADRFERLLRQDAALIAPQRTYTGWESLRKYRAHAGDVAGEDRALEQMAAGGWNANATYRTILARGMGDSDASARQTRLVFLLGQIEARLRSPRPEQDYRHIPARRLHELLAATLVAMRYRGDGDAARAAYATFSTRVTGWREGPFVQAVLDAGRPMAAKADIAAACVDTSCTDPVLLSTAGDHLVAAGRHREAALLFARAIDIEPGAWPVVYRRLARLQEVVLHDPAAALRVLERCARECLLSPDRDEVLAEIERLRGRM